jgi:sn-glycerol 3-phosphate transport system ATP-binding protein
MDVYERPASVFVAGFIGSPAMNFLAGKVVEGSRAIELAGTGAVRVVLQIGLATTAAAGTPVAVGIRPEHLHPAADGPLEFEIELAEPLGADTLLHGRFGEASELVTVRQSGHILARPGEKMRFKADPGHLHLFDSQTGKRIPDAA